LELRRLPQVTPGGGGWRGRVKRTLSAPGFGVLRELVWPGEFVFVAVPAGT
jgi:hypothetical protein